MRSPPPPVCSSSSVCSLPWGWRDEALFDSAEVEARGPDRHRWRYDRDARGLRDRAGGRREGRGDAASAVRDGDARRDGHRAEVMAWTGRARQPRGDRGSDGGAAQDAGRPAWVGAGAARSARAAAARAPGEAVDADAPARGAGGGARG